MENIWQSALLFSSLDNDTYDISISIAAKNNGTVHSEVNLHKVGFLNLSPCFLTPDKLQNSSNCFVFLWK